MLTIDGASGEGGGQVLRSALALSVATGQPFRIQRIRAGRKKPGLARQHLTAVQAAARVGGARVDGAALGSQEILFEPTGLLPGEHRFSVGSAGSAGLVLQTILPALLLAKEPSHLVLEGGTHNQFAPPYDFLERCYVPQIGRLGARVALRLERPGFFPAGGGRFEATIEPVRSARVLSLQERGDIHRRRAVALVARLPRRVGEREIEVVRRELGWQEDELEVVEVRDSRGPGNVLLLELAHEHVTEIVTGFGRLGVRAEAVAGAAADAMQEYESSTAPVGLHLADQLLVPLVLLAGGTFRTPALSAHAATNIDVIHRFLPERIVVGRIDDDVVVQVHPPG